MFRIKWIKKDSSSPLNHLEFLDPHNKLILLEFKWNYAITKPIVKFIIGTLERLQSFVIGLNRRSQLVTESIFFLLTTYYANKDVYKMTIVCGARTIKNEAKSGLQLRFSFIPSFLISLALFSNIFTHHLKGT